MRAINPAYIPSNWSEFNRLHEQKPHCIEITKQEYADILDEIDHAETFIEAVEVHKSYKGVKIILLK